MGKRIDAHNHLLLRDREESELLATMDEGGVEKTVLLALEPPCLHFCGAPLAGNEVVCEVCRRHADRLVFFLGVHPLLPDAEQTVRKYADLGARGVKLFPPMGFYPDDPPCLRVYETVAELGLAVLSHTGATNLPIVGGAPRQVTASHFADPIRFDGLARMFPEINWILAHMGYPWSINAWTVAAHNRGNVYLDLCADGPWLTFHPHMYNAIGRSIPLDFGRVLWGTDRVVRPAEHVAKVEAVLRAMGCPEEAFAGVFGDNAARLLGL